MSMKYVFAADEYNEAIERLGLDTPDAWMACAVEVAAMDRTTETRRLRPPSPLPGCYAKIYRYPRWDDRIRILFRGGLVGRGRARVELDNLRRLGERGLSPRVIAYAVEREYGLLKTALLVIEEVEGAAAMDAFAAGQLGTLTPGQRRCFVEELAAFTQRMNAGGYINSEYHWRNILVRQTADGFAFQVIDPSSSRRRLRFWYPYFDLATLDVCGAFFFTRSERLRFLKWYWGCPGRPLTRRQKKQVGKIAALRDTLAAKELKRYGHILTNVKCEM
jgi:hypothetical protein